jgi:hypothetical protein
VDSASGQQPGQTAPPARPVIAADRRALAGGAYAMLFLLGVMEGVLGCFWYGSGPVPLAALGFDALLLATCLLAGWGMRRPTGGLMPTVGWFLASFVLAMGTKGGSVVITDSSAGKWFLFGGAATAVAGAVAAFVRWSRPVPPLAGAAAERKPPG